MTQNKKELAVAALRNGTVIDRVPCNKLFKAVRILGVEKMTNNVTIGNNLSSRALGTKGIIKVADTEFPEDVLNRIAIIAPKAKINIIRDYEVAEKRRVELPDEIIGIVRCNNPKCISNNEPMRSRFRVINRNDITLRCHYCDHVVKADEALID